MTKNISKIIKIAKKKGSVSSGDLIEAGVSRTMLPYLANSGILRRIGRGVYILANFIPANETLISVSASIPKGVVCLLSALQFHEITTQLPMKTWVAIERNSSVPKAIEDSVKLVRLSGASFTEGIEEQQLDGIIIRVYNPAKTVADCFKFRNKLGFDIAREALVDCLEQKKATRDEIYRYAKVCRVNRVIKPYLEMV